MMKSLASLASMAALAMVLSTGVWAAPKDQGKFTLADSAQVGSTTLQPGQYKAEWQPENGNHVKVDIVQHGKVVATAQGTLKSLPQPAPYGAVVMKTLNHNAKAIDEIDFNKRAEALVISGE